MTNARLTTAYGKLLVSLQTVRQRGDDEHGAVTAEIAAFIIVGLIFVGTVAGITGQVATTLGARINALVGGF